MGGGDAAEEASSHDERWRPAAGIKVAWFIWFDTGRLVLAVGKLPGCCGWKLC